MIRQCLLPATALVAAAALLSSCGYFPKKAPDPDKLVAWVVEHAVPLAKAKDYKAPPGSDPVHDTADGKGIEFSRPTSTTPVKMGLYYIPVTALDEKLDTDLRAAFFPNGTAMIKPVGDEAVGATVPAADLDKLYLLMAVLPGSGHCGDDGHACDSAMVLGLMAKLRGPLIGKGARSLHLIVPDVLDLRKLIKDQGVDPQAICGFDDEKDRVPQHIASACSMMALTQFASEHDFAVGLGLMPLTPEGITLELRELIAQSLYKDGMFRGEYSVDQEGF